MRTETQSSEKLRRSSCAGCSAERCPLEADLEAQPVSGRQFGLAAASTFLAPIALAIVGALCLRGSGWSQLLGALLGFGCGTALSLALVRPIARGRAEGLTQR